MQANRIPTLVAALALTATLTPGPTQAAPAPQQAPTVAAVSTGAWSASCYKGRVTRREFRRTRMFQTKRKVERRIYNARGCTVGHTRIDGIPVRMVRYRTSRQWDQSVSRVTIAYYRADGPEGDNKLHVWRAVGRFIPKMNA